MSRMSFAVDADSISLKSIMKKDFLELQMRAISTANPNLNGSWFTKEALEDAIDDCKNKPILGYFNSDGDFESHNGTWKKDIETGLDYWDTQNGEQVLGLIRENDDIKVVDDEDGLSWLCLSCALWTQYNFKQVKRLIKDAKRAKENGGVTKNISVEIDIKEGEKMDNGVYRIDKFKLMGITILGSRKGKKVLPGIEDAALSIPEIIGSDFYEKQETAIRAAYARLDNNDGGDEEDVLKMDLLNKDLEQENIQPTTDPSEPTQFEEGAGAGEGEICPICGNNPCTCAKKEDEACDGGKPKDEESFEGQGNDDGKDDDKDDDGDKGDDDKGDEGKKDNKDEYAQEPTNTEEVRDVAWLIGNVSYNTDNINCTIGYYNYLIENEPDKAPHGAYIVSVLKRILNAETKVQGTLGGLLNKLAGEITEADEQYEAKLAQYENVDELIENYEKAVASVEELTANNNSLTQEKEQFSKDNEELKTRLEKYAHEEFMAQVDNLIKSVKLDEAVTKEIYEACTNGSLQDYNEVKTKVAFAVLEAQQNIENTENTQSLQSPVVNPDVQAAFEAKAEKGQKRDSWTIMREYRNKRS